MNSTLTAQADFDAILVSDFETGRIIYWNLGAERNLNLRLGRQVVAWGECNAGAAISLSRLRSEVELASSPCVLRK